MTLLRSFWSAVDFRIHDWRMKNLFEKTFENTDPWGFESWEYEKRKYHEQVLLLGERKFDKVLEIGCAEGVFTEQLSALAREVVGLDIAKLAVKRARQRLRGLSGVRVERGSITNHPLTPDYDLIVASEVLYYLSEGHGRAHLDLVCRKLFGALIPGGLFLMSNWYDPAQPHSVAIERNIKNSLLDAGFKEREELFRQGSKGNDKHHYCLLLLEKGEG